jgi:hypothetical protein
MNTWCDDNVLLLNAEVARFCSEDYPTMDNVWIAAIVIVAATYWWFVYSLKSTRGGTMLATHPSERVEVKNDNFPQAAQFLFASWVPADQQVPPHLRGGDPSLHACTHAPTSSTQSLVGCLPRR